MAMQREQDNCEGRGFSAVDTSGWCAKFYTWITKNAAAGGPGWVMLRDVSNPSAETVASVDTTDDELEITGHGFKIGDTVRVASTGDIPTGLSGSNKYWVNVVDANTIKLCTSRYYALYGNAVNITSVGSGTITVSHTGPHIYVGDRAAPASPNDPIKVLKVGYDNESGSNVRINVFGSWNSTYDFPNFLWSGYSIDTLDAAVFAYDFRGNTEFLLLQSYIASESGSSPWYGWYPVLIDEWTGFTNFVDPVTVIGNVASASVFNSTAISVELASSAEASSFTKGQGYFVYDFTAISASSHRCQVAYGVIDAIGTADGLASDAHIRFESLGDVVTGSDVMPVGAIVTPYMHRFYSSARQGPGEGDFSTQAYGSHGKIPYYSYNNANLAAYAYHGQSGEIPGGIYIDREETTLLQEAPGDDGSYAVQRPAIVEFANTAGNANYGLSMNRRWGEMKNVFVCDDNGMQIMSTGRIINTKDYLSIGTENSWFAGASSGLEVLIQHTEET